MPSERRASLLVAKLNLEQGSIAEAKRD